MSASTPNAFLNIDDAHLRVTSGNVYAQGLNISGISFSGVSGLQTVTNTGNVTTNTLEFKNGEKAFVATSNVDVKGSLDVANVATIYNGSNADYDQKQKFTSTVSASGNYFSNTLAVSTNGLYAIVGAHGEDKAYTFTRSGSTWTQENIFSSTTGSAFGYAVDISSDGTYAIVGGNGSASVFYRSSGSTWDSGTTLTAGGISVTTGYGASVSISDDGSYAIVGATGQNAAYIFRRTGTTTWDAGVKIALTGFTLGFSVAISGDGLYALLGAHAQHTAYVFKRTGAYIWSQQVKITESDSFGYSVALSTDGSRALIGAMGGNGKAYSYERSGSDWSQNAIITASDAASGDAFGSAVSLSSDGSYALVGAPGNEKAYTFKNAGTVWSELGIETASDATAGHVFGRSVSISGDGIYALVGASGNEAAYSYERKETLVLDVRGEANVRTLNVSDDLTSNNLTVAGNLNVTTIRSDSNVVAEYTGPHDRPLRKYPEVALTQNDESATSGYVASGSDRLSASYEYYEAFDLKTNLTDNNTANTGLYNAWLSPDSRFDSNGDADLTTSSTFPGTSYRGEYCALKLPKAIKLDNFHIFPRGDASSYANSNPPKDLRIFGSNDGTTWTHIKQFQNLGFTGRSGLRLHVNDSNTYNEYAFFVEKITVSSGGVGYCAIGGIELYGHEEGSGSLDTTLKTVYNVPATTGTQLEVYYDAKDLAEMPTDTVTDLAGGDQNGTVTGHSPTLDSTDGINSFVFDGVDDYITSTLTGLSSSQYTMAGWIKVNTLDSTVNTFFGLGDWASGNGRAIGVAINSNNVIGANVKGLPDATFSEVVTGEWYHVVADFTSDNDTHLYVNGKLVDTVAGTTFAIPTNPPLFVGSRANASGTVETARLFPGSIANFRLYSKALNADQVKELYDYQKDYFLGSKSQVTLYKGHLGVGVTEPSGQLELAGDERIQEYPPRGMTHSDGTATGSQTGGQSKNITYIEGHGEFKASASKWSTGTLGYDGQQPYNAFEDTVGERWLIYENVGYNATTGAYEDNEYKLSASSGTPYGHWLKLEMPYAVNIRNYYMKAQNTSHGAKDWQVWASNDDINWTHIHSYTNETSANSFAGSYYNVSHTGHYKMFAIIVTRIFNASTQDRIDIFRVKYFGTPGPTTLDKGSLSLTRSLDVPRVSRYDVDTETPRPEKLVLDFDTTVNSSPTDISGKGNHGSFYGHAKYSAADKAFVFDGSGDYIQGTLGVNGTELNSSYTISLWVKSDSTANDTAVFMFIGSSGPGDSIGFRHNNNISSGGTEYLLYHFAVTDTSATSQPTNLKQWRHLVAMYDGTNHKIFVDGVLAVTAAASDLNTIPNNPTYSIGYRWNGGTAAEYFDGMISNPKLYSVALEPSEVKKLYKLGRTGRSMVISDTAVGIGKVPEANLDVRGNLNVDGVITNQQRPAFYVWRDGTGLNVEAIGHGGQDRLAVTGVITNWDSKRIDTAGTFDLSNGRYYIPVSGLYMLIGAGVYRYQSGNGILEASFYVNGSNVGPRGISYNRGNTTSEHHTVTITFMRFMNAGDYVQMGVPVCQSACDFYYGDNLGYFSGYLLG